MKTQREVNEDADQAIKELCAKNNWVLSSVESYKGGLPGCGYARVGATRKTFWIVTGTCPITGTEKQAQKSIKL